MTHNSQTYYAYQCLLYTNTNGALFYYFPVKSKTFECSPSTFDYNWFKIICDILKYIISASFSSIKLYFHLVLLSHFCFHPMFLHILFSKDLKAQIFRKFLLKSHSFLTSYRMSKSKCFNIYVVFIDVTDSQRVVLSTNPSLSICDVCSSIEPELHTMSLQCKYTSTIEFYVFAMFYSQQHGSVHTILWEKYAIWILWIFV